MIDCEEACEWRFIWLHNQIGEVTGKNHVTLTSRDGFKSVMLKREVVVFLWWVAGYGDGDGFRGIGKWWYVLWMDQYGNEKKLLYVVIPWICK